MNNSIITVTHVEISSQHFIKIHGQTNRENVYNVSAAVSTMIGIFSTFPPPVMKMLQPDCLVLVYYDSKYFRGKFIKPDAKTTASVLLIDLGYMINIELANVRQTLHESKFLDPIISRQIYVAVTSSRLSTRRVRLLNQRTAARRGIHSQSLLYSQR